MPVRFWVIWWASLAVAMVVFYVVLTPIWLGLRAPAGSPSCGRARSREPQLYQLLRAAAAPRVERRRRVDLPLRPQAGDAIARVAG